MFMFFYYSLLVTLVTFPVYYYFIKNINKSLLLCFITGLLYFFHLLYKYRNVLWLKNNYDKKIVLNEILELQKVKNKQKLLSGSTYPYKTFRLNYNETIDTNRIPKIIFRMSGFSFENIPIEIKNVLDDCTIMNPEYIQIYLDNHDCNLFIEEFYPQYSQSYHSIIPGAFKSDIIRLLLLHKYGGVYSDIGHTFLKPLDSFIEHSDKIILVKDRDVTLLDNLYSKIINKFIYTISRSYAIHNAFIAIIPNHPLMIYISDYINKNIINKIYGENSLDITGPLVVGKLYNLFFEKDKETPLTVGKNENSKIFYLNQVDNNLKIVDENNQPLIKTKFSKYRKIMYSKNHPYGDLWNMSLVYF